MGEAPFFFARLEWVHVTLNLYIFGKKKSVIKMNEMQREEVNAIINSILSSVPALEIYLFGSFVNGMAREDSDYDFYIVIPDDSDLREREVTWAIRGAIPRQTRGIDMLVGTQSKFNRRKNYLYSIENEVIEKGVKLYG